MAMIDSNKLYRRIAGHSKYSGDAILTAISCLAEGKEIHDVPWLKNYVEVVRCKDCLWANTNLFAKELGIVYCNNYGKRKKRDDFCSEGERKDGE